MPSQGKYALPSKELTARELEVLKLLASGKVPKEVCAELGIAPQTVDAHRTNVYRKLGIHSVVLLAHYAIGKGLVPVMPFDKGNP